MQPKRNIFLYFLILLFMSGFAGCKLKRNESGGTAIKTNAEKTQKQLSESSLLLKELDENGDYVNSNNFPSLIKASIVHEELNKNNLIIDLRDYQYFSRGHIKGAVNVRLNNLPDYFISVIKPFEYEKIIMVCDDGQVSSYATSLLRLMGYGNVYAMRWGMSGWNKNYARNYWLKGVSDKYENQLETKTNEPPAPSEMPELKTGLSIGEEILDARFRDLFANGSDSILITADEVFLNPARYFIINFERKDKYEDGHIPGAVRYKPESTLGFEEVMSTIPKDQKVVIYCGTGHLSGFATAYLRLFGYDARTLKYGNNSFMYDKMIREKSTLSWLPFTIDEASDFSLVR